MNKNLITDEKKTFVLQVKYHTSGLGHNDIINIILINILQNQKQLCNNKKGLIPRLAGGRDSEETKAERRKDRGPEEDEWEDGILRTMELEDGG